MPFLAEHFPGHHVFGLRADPLGEFLEAGDGPFEERPEGGRVDFIPRVGVDLHFLPRAAEVFALHSRAAAVGFDFVDVVERLEAEVGDELAAVECFLRGAKLEFDQPPLAGDRVEEPAVGFFGGGDFDDRAIVPIRFGEVACFLDAAFDGVENAAVPLGVTAIAGDAILRVPTAAVDFPRHARVAADVVDFDIILARSDFRFGVVQFALRRMDRRRERG